MKKQEKFEKTHETFMQEVIKPYDTRLKGNYFIHQYAQNNSKNKGINSFSGGVELVKKGQTLITSSAQLYAEEFAKLYKEIQERLIILEKSDYSEDERSLVTYDYDKLSNFEFGLNMLNKECDFTDSYPNRKLYSAIAEFKQVTPENYRQGMGEMVLHQTRLANMIKGGESAPYQFGRLDSILQVMPNPRFLGDKYPLVGEGLVREVLSSKNGERSINEAKKAISRYGLKGLVERKPEIRTLLEAVVQMDSK
jgi:hypothetical protein